MDELKWVLVRVVFPILLAIIMAALVFKILGE